MLIYYISAIDDDFADILLTPEPPRQTRKHTRRSSTVTNSLGSRASCADAHVLENEIFSELSNVNAFAKFVEDAEPRWAKYKASAKLEKTLKQQSIEQNAYIDK